METYAEPYEYFHGHHSHHSFHMQQSNPGAATGERHVLAERYKTKMCRNYLTTGDCPYEVRCMFAHGDHELRSCEMNLRDGLITEEAIKSFQRAFYARTHSMRPSQPTAAQVEYVGLPPMSLNGERYAHNPYGYAVARSSSMDNLVKEDPTEAMEP